MKHTSTYCKGCKWWSPLAEQGAMSRQGECRRYPPTVFFAGKMYYKYCEVSSRGFPITTEDVWCGEAHF
jgi:hypothetical protein